MSAPKQVIVMRTKYPDAHGGFMSPRKGKLCAQAAHASMKVLLDRKLVLSAAEADDGMVKILLTEPMRQWIEGSFTKIVVGCDSEQELLDLKAKAEAAGIPCALIEDNGWTEFSGVKTLTALAIGPDYPERIDPITGGLKLL